MGAYRRRDQGDSAAGATRRPASELVPQPADGVLPNEWESTQSVAHSGAMRAALEALAFLERSCEVAGEPIAPAHAAERDFQDDL